MTNEAVRPKLNTPEIQTQGRQPGGIILNIKRENKWDRQRKSEFKPFVCTPDQMHN